MKKILLISLVIMVLNTCITSGLQNNNINEVEMIRLEMFEMKNVTSDIEIKEDEFITTSRGNGKRYIPIIAIVTAYAPYDNKSGICNDGTPDTTATGTKPKMGTLASDPDRIPYGTKIHIPDYGFGVVEDTGSALREDKDNIRIDIFMETYEEAMEWGKREMIIYVEEGYNIEQN